MCSPHLVHLSRRDIFLQPEGMPLLHCAESFVLWHCLCFVFGNVLQIPRLGASNKSIPDDSQRQPLSKPCVRYFHSQLARRGFGVILFARSLTCLYHDLRSSSVTDVRAWMYAVTCRMIASIMMEAGGHHAWPQTTTSTFAPKTHVTKSASSVGQ